ncbi:MAG: FAD-dependent thymidylate synthase [Treponema sp.]|uniref:FAD-dependent thymidylate synthase n=1 Tax=Treponema sp. TaxID=166 RepID=UPI00298EA97B|nr:FAD-dependent thymidylate synthase [Treponema sp.]MBR5933456.1 FAD-dependent thymidylate synthase [Treponema sp.]
MAHCIVPEAEEILEKEFKVLDKGFVRLVDYLGSDDRIVQAARVSYGDGTQTVTKDEALIDYLMRQQHTSPFEQVVFTFHLKMPIFIARQWVRHRMGRINEISGRLSVMKEEFYVPDIKNIDPQKKDKLERALEPLEPEEAEKIQKEFVKGQKKSYEAYKSLIESGLAREIARINLPLSLYTEFYWQMDLNNLFHFLKLRLDTHAQLEMREYAKTILNIVRKVCPVATASFENVMLKSVSFNGEEIVALRKVLSGETNPLSGKKLDRFLTKVKNGLQL